MKQVLGGLMIAFLVLGGLPTVEHAQIGHEQAQAGNVFYQKIDQIEKMAEKGKWQNALNETAALRKIFQQKLWKLQLLGDEGEYEGLNRELDQLNAAIQAKDKAQTKIELAAVRAFIKSIYSM